MLGISYCSLCPVLESLCDLSREKDRCRFSSPITHEVEPYESCCSRFIQGSGFG